MKTEYIINKEKRTVVCIISGVSYQLKHDLQKQLTSQQSKEFEWLINTIFNNPNLQLKKQYIGIAKCNEADTFDEKTGKVLAARRATLKYEIDKTNKLNFVFQQLKLLFKTALDKQSRKEEFECSRLVELEENLFEGTIHYDRK